MKKIILSASLIVSATALFAQSLETAGRQMYYERYQSAEQSYHTILNQQPNNAQAWYGLTTAYLMQNQAAQAYDSLHKAPAAIGGEPFYQVALGSVLLEQGKTDSAALYFNQALNETKSKNPEVLSAIASAHIHAKNGNVNEALELINKALKRDKRSASLRVLMGDAYRKLDNGTEAYKAYKEALEHDDKNAAAHFKIGEIFLTQKNPDLYLQYFKDALTADANYAPAIYQLYIYSFYNDAAKAMQYYNDYVSKSDYSIQNDYDLTDLYYLNKDYSKAVAKANELLQAEGAHAKPRLYKLLGYSYAGMKDSAAAINYMEAYFNHVADSNIIAKDYEIMAQLFAATPGKEDSAMAYYEKVVGLEKDSASLYNYYKKLATFAQNQKNYEAQAKWLSKFYTGNDYATNVDLFNWALASYRAADYKMADSVFGMYVEKYPEQSFGYYWQARSNVALDSGMKQGLAIPYYHKLIDVMQKDTANSNYKSWMIEAYAYLAAYEANMQQDYDEAITYFEKVLEVDPTNEEAKKYIAILEQNQNNGGSK